MIKQPTMNYVVLCMDFSLYSTRRMNVMPIQFNFVVRSETIQPGAASMYPCHVYSMLELNLAVFLACPTVTSNTARFNF